MFISDLYPGSTSDKQLTRRSGILGLLEESDSVMDNRGFDIEKYLDLLGVFMLTGYTFICSGCNMYRKHSYSDSV